MDMVTCMYMCTDMNGRVYGALVQSSAAAINTDMSEFRLSLNYHGYACMVMYIFFHVV